MKNLIQSKKLSKIPEISKKTSLTEFTVKESFLEPEQMPSTLQVDDASEKSFTEITNQERLAQLKIDHE